MLENIRISLRGIWSHKMRSLLTMLGIIIGIAAIIAIVSTIMGTNEQIKNNLIGAGNNAVDVVLYQDGFPADFSYTEPPQGVPAFDEQVKDELLAIDGAESVSFYHMRQYSDNLFHLNTNLSGTYIVGVDSDYLSAAGLHVIEGRGFGDTDLTHSRKVCLIDETVASSLSSGDSAVGEMIEIGKEPFTVVGVVRQKSEFEPTIKSINDYYLYKGSSSGSVYIPDQMWPTVFRYDEPVGVKIRAASTDQMTTVGKQCCDLLNTKMNVGDESTVSYQANDLAEQASQLQRLASSTNTMLVGIASISLLVGGIGVMNIMLVSVTERTHEIGLKKALGARKRTVLAQFLTEAVMLSLIGGILGVVAGIALSHVIAAIASVPVMISVAVVVIAVAFSMIVGVVFGLVPSVKAANLNPIDALRYE